MSPTKRPISIVLVAAAVVSMPLVAAPATASDKPGPCHLHREQDEPQRRFSRRLIRCAVDRWPVRGGARRAICIARHESGLDPKAVSRRGRYVGLYQHDVELWPDRFEAWTRRRWQLNPDALNGRSNAIVSIRMASANGWGPWRTVDC